MKIWKNSRPPVVLQLCINLSMDRGSQWYRWLPPGKYFQKCNPLLFAGLSLPWRKIHEWSEHKINAIIELSTQENHCIDFLFGLIHELEFVEFFNFRNYLPNCETTHDLSWIMDGKLYAPDYPILLGTQLQSWVSSNAPRTVFLTFIYLKGMGVDLFYVWSIASIIFGKVLVKLGHTHKRNAVKSKFSAVEKENFIYGNQKIWAESNISFVTFIFNLCCSCLIINLLRAIFVTFISRLATKNGSSSSPTKSVLIHL